jgi:hypothetical protein
MDDIFLAFKGAKADLQLLLDDLSANFKPFTIGWQIHSTSDRCSFLDIEFFFEKGFGPFGVQSKVYRKKLNRHQYIPWSSAHPVSVKRAFVKAELTRYMTISSTYELFEEKVQEFMIALSRRGYPADILAVWKKLVNYRDRHIVLFKKKTTARGIPLMLPSAYDKVWEYIDLKDVFETMRNTWRTHPEPLPEAFNMYLIKSLRRTDNLFDKLSSWNKAILKPDNLKRCFEGEGDGPVRRPRTELLQDHRPSKRAMH